MCGEEKASQVSKQQMQVNPEKSAVWIKNYYNSSHIRVSIYL